MRAVDDSCLGTPVDVSIVTPCNNEESGITRIASEFGPVLTILWRDYTVELVFVDYGSTDGTWAEVTKLAEERLLASPRPHTPIEAVTARNAWRHTGI